MSDTIEDIVDLAVGHDETVSRAARQLTAQAIVEIARILKYGTPQAKQQILRSFVPPLIRHAQGSQQSEELAELRREMDALKQDMDEYETPEEDPEVVPEVPTDA